MNRESFVRNIIAKTLGLLWILDALLQFQPQMFGAGFVNAVLVPNLSDQPAFMHALVTFGINLWNLNPVASDIAAALLQVAIGILLLFPLSGKRFRTGAWVSIIWGLIVWVFGEGTSLLLTGNAGFYTGAPGAVLFYVIPAAFLLMEHAKLSWLPKVAGWTLVIGAALQLQPVFWSTDGIAGSVMAPMMEPYHMVSSVPTYILNVLSIDPLIGNWILVLIPLVIGLSLLFKPNRITGGIALAFLFLVWWWGQDFGALTTLISGTSTDPNTAPLLALLVLPLFFDPYPSSTIQGMLADEVY